MSRALERAYDLVVRGDEVLSLEHIGQLRAENNKTPDQIAVTDGSGGFVMKNLSDLGSGLPTPPLGQNDALTVDPAGVVRWGGTISAGSF
jgi:hypothetical protein